MKLYYSPGACSLSPHIVLNEAGLEYQLEKVSLGKHQTADGADFYQINPKGYVPALELDDGQVLTEGPAIVQYLADRKPEAKLAPPAGSIERYRLIEWLNFISTELHKQFGPLFHGAGEAEKERLRALIGRRFDYIEAQLAGKPYLLGDAFTVADAYLFTMLSWTRHAGIDLGKWPALKDYFARVGARPKVKETLKREGLAG
ncbi:MAG TPA: glutathione transferase GstA [Burkholderiales bacterium]|nr:glutathione transferase GstA [Burkholderiales bacterium]